MYLWALSDNINKCITITKIYFLFENIHRRVCLYSRYKYWKVVHVIKMDPKLD